MLAHKILKDTTVDISDEAYEHYKLVEEGIKSLSNESEMSWSFCEMDLFSKALRVSKLEGFVLGAAAVGAIVGVTNFVKKRKNKAKK